MRPCDVKKCSTSDKELEIILIRPDLLELTRQGKKYSTCRYGIRNYPLGKTILMSNQAEDFIYINITKINYCKFYELTDEVARMDGFKDVQELKTILGDIYGYIPADADMSIIEFNLEDL